ncbi:hypothetical protein CF327_g4070 [Tilletia walkeri]|nr:hypothetical protein CF327_g4071 [Tilletia walkeri]KAE8212282.1 hypothetical protein CF327_g4070 [Tilletia walkeri]
MAVDSSSSTAEAAAASSSFKEPDSNSKGVGGRSLKIRKDGVAYTDTNKIIAVHYAFFNAKTKKRKIDEAVEELGCGKTALYSWKKSFPVAAGAVNAAPDSALAKIMAVIQSRSDQDNLRIFRQPTFSGATPPDGATSSPTSSHPSSSSYPGAPPASSTPSLAPAFARPDGLGPQAENPAISGIHPGMLSALLISALRRIEDAAPVSDDELRKVEVVMDGDVETSAVAFVEESVSLGVRLKDQNLKDSTKSLWVPHQKHFIAWWRALNRLRAATDKEGIAAESEEVLVTEQKLLTWLNCYVLYRNPTLVYESVRTHVKAIKNLWEFQVALKKNPFPAPDGHLVSQYLKAISLSRAAQSRALGSDKFTNSLKDGYDRQGHIDHAIIGRSEDLRDRELSDFYACELPESRPQPCPIIVATQLSSKTNKEARPERGIAARHKDVEVCPVGAFGMWLLQRFGGKDGAPDFSSRDTWYHLKLLIPEDSVDHTIAVTYETQAALLKQSFAACAITSSAVTHAMRKGGSRFAYEASCTEDAVRKHGRWCGDRMMERYLTGVSLQPVRALSGFNKDGGDYWLPRALLEPPQELARSLFPWVEAKEEDIKKRLLHGGESDAAALEFLAMLKFMRVVLLQDMAMLQENHPSFPFFSTAPFNTTAFFTFQTALKEKIRNTPTPFEMSLESLMPAVCHALASVRTAVEEIRMLISSATAELKAQVQAVENRAEERHAEVMSAVGTMLLMGQGGSRKNDNQARAVQTMLVDGIKTVMTLLQQVQQISLGAEVDIELPINPTPSSITTNAANFAVDPASTAYSSTISSPPPPPSSSAAQQSQSQQQLRQLLLSLTNVNPSPPLLVVPGGSAFTLPLVRNAVELWEEWTIGREGKASLETIRVEDEDRYENDKKYVRRLAATAAIRQQLYRWAKVVSFIKEVAEEGQGDGGDIARLLDTQMRKDKGKLSSPLRSMAEILLNAALKDELKRAILSSLPSASSVSGPVPMSA